MQKKHILFDNFNFPWYNATITIKEESEEII